MTNKKEAELPEILAELRALAGDLQDETRLGDDGIPVLTTPLASPARPTLGTHALGAAIPTLSDVIARPERELVLAEAAPSPTDAVSAQIRAQAIIQRTNALWREAGNSPLTPGMIAALELALAEALQNPS